MPNENSTPEVKALKAQLASLGERVQNLTSHLTDAQLQEDLETLPEYAKGFGIVLTDADMDKVMTHAEQTRTSVPTAFRDVFFERIAKSRESGKDNGSGTRGGVVSARGVKAGATMHKVPAEAIAMARGLGVPIERYIESKRQIDAENRRRSI